MTWTLEPLDGGKRTRVTPMRDGFEYVADVGDYGSGCAGFLHRLERVVVELGGTKREGRSRAFTAE